MDFCQSDTFRMEAMKEGVSPSSIIVFFEIQKQMKYSGLLSTFSCKQLKVVDRTLVAKLLFLCLFLQLDFQFLQLVPRLQVERGQLRVPLTIELGGHLLQLLLGLQGGHEGLRMLSEATAN